jgi:hypothetical protein
MRLKSPSTWKTTQYAIFAHLGVSSQTWNYIYGRNLLSRLIFEATADSRNLARRHTCEIAYSDTKVVDAYSGACLVTEDEWNQDEQSTWKTLCRTGQAKVVGAAISSKFIRAMMTKAIIQSS